MSYTVDVLEEHIRELEQKLTTILSELKDGIPVWMILEEYGGSG